MQLEDIVKDWGGFEELVKDLHNNGNISVERDITLIGNSGASRQIDVLLKHTKGLYEYMTLIECKFWSKKVERANIDILYSSMQDLNASKGVFFTTKGYQIGADIFAKSKGIEIFVIRDLTDEEWGLPGKIINLYLQILSKTVLNINTPNTKISYPVGIKQKMEPNLNISFGKKDNHSDNIIISSHKNKCKTLEQYLEKACEHALNEFSKKSFLINSGEECIRYFQITINMPFNEKGEELKLFKDNCIIFIPKIELTIGIKVNQSEIIFDRSENHIYTLAIENCINKQVYIASKKDIIDSTNWDKIEQPKINNHDDIVKNGSIISVISEELFAPEEMNNLTVIKV